MLLIIGFIVIAKEVLGILSMFSVQFYVNFLSVFYIFHITKVCSKIRLICKYFSYFLHILEIMITDKNSDQSRNV